MSDSPLHVFNSPVIESGDMSLVSVTSISKNIQEVISFAVQAVWTGTSPVGTLDIQGSNDDITYTSVLPAAAAVSGNSGSLMVNIEKHAYGYVRVVYTKTSGTGTLNVRINAKRG